MKQTALRGAKQRILRRLKLKGETTTSSLAKELGVTEAAVRQHFTVLHGVGLVRRRTRSPRGRGRPAILWSMTDQAQKEFPERHAELAVSLIETTREALGDAALERIIEARARRQVEEYREQMPPPTAPMGRRVATLARIRTAEGYMAEVVREAKGTFLLIEHHCPICDAARCCLGLCSAELRVFQEVLGPGTTVERTRHLLNGDDRCAYRISTAGSTGRSTG